MKLEDDLNYALMSFNILNNAHCKLSKDQREFFENMLSGIKVIDSNTLFLYVHETIDKNNIASIKEKNFTLVCSLFDHKIENSYNYKYAFQNCKIDHIIPTLFIPEENNNIKSENIFKYPEVVIFKVSVSYEDFIITN